MTLTVSLNGYFRAYTFDFCSFTPTCIAYATSNKLLAVFNVICNGGVMAV